MTNNPLDRRRKETNPDVVSPVFETRQAWCDWRNSVMKRDDLEWIIDPSGNPHLQTKPEKLLERSKKDFERREAERQAFNHRMRFPITAIE